MRELTIPLPRGAAERYDYAVVIDELDVGPFCCESYGVKVRERATGYEAVVPHVTTSAARIDELMGRLVEHRVSPDNLRGVVEDWL